MSRYEIGAGGALRWSEGATVNERSMNKNAGMFRCSELAARRKGHRSGKETAGLYIKARRTKVGGANNYWHDTVEAKYRIRTILTRTASS